MVVWGVDKEGGTHIPLQAQELPRGPGDFFPSRRGGDPPSESTRAQAFRERGRRGLARASLRVSQRGLTPFGKSAEFNALTNLGTAIEEQGRPRNGNKKKRAGTRCLAAGGRPQPREPWQMVPLATAAGAPPPPEVAEEAWPVRAAILGASLGALFTTRWSPAPAPPLPSHCLEEPRRPQRLLFISPQCPDVNGLQCIFQGNLLSM